MYLYVTQDDPNDVAQHATVNQEDLKSVVRGDLMIYQWNAAKLCFERCDPKVDKDTFEGFYPTWKEVFRG